MLVVVGLLALIVWLVWSRNISFGYWFATSQCLVWSLGTATYYMLPTLGPGFAYSWLYQDLPDTGSGALMDSLFYARKGVLRDGIEGAVVLSGAGDGVAQVLTNKTLPPATVALIDPETGTSSGGGTTDVKVAPGEELAYDYAYVLEERLGRRHSASLVAAGGHAYFVDDDGETFVVKAAPTYELVSQNTLGEPCFASPAVSRGQLFIRTEKHLYCIGNPR